MISKKEVILILILITVITSVNVLAAEPLPYVFETAIGKQLKLEQDGVFSVTKYTGSAEYSYPIAVPQGTNNLQPQISIYYDSHKTKQSPSKLGTAWEISQSYIQRDTNNTFKDTKDDKFKLNFNGVVYDIVYVSSEKRFHTKIESFLHVKNETGAHNARDMYWVVKTRDGTRYRFGFNNNSETVANKYNYVWRWNIDYVNDTHNNSIYYTYIENQFANDTGSVYLDKIEYNNDKKRKIQFGYELSNRPDLRSVYDNGNLLSETRRLKRITIKADDTLVRRYEIGYIGANATNVTNVELLHNITLFGSDNTTKLPSINFTYGRMVGGWVNFSTWEPPVCFVQDNEGTDKGYRLVDFTSDGRADILYGRNAGSGCSSSDKSAWINTGGGWVEKSSWAPPACFVLEPGEDLGYRFADANGDGRVDILWGREDAGSCSPSTERRAWLNNGSGWVESTTWQPPVCFMRGGVDLGYRLVDFTGDGKVDILLGKENTDATCTTQTSWINNGAGWTLDSSWKPPECFVSSNGVDRGYRIFDVNGDGLDDITYGQQTPLGQCDSGNTKAWLNNGSSWARNDTYEPPRCFILNGGEETGYRLADVNGDGLDDLIQGWKGPGNPNTCGASDKEAWLNTGKGWKRSDAFETPDGVCFRTNSGFDTGQRLADVNGDGITDILFGWTGGSCVPENRDAWISNASKSEALLLKEIKTSTGGTIKIKYKKSTYVDNIAKDNTSHLNFNLHLVANFTEDNGINNSQKTKKITVYNYSDGFYDYQKREFRGFGQVNETIANAILIKRHYHQDDTRQGREFVIETYNISKKPFKKVHYVWKNKSQNGYSIVELIRQSEETYDGSPTNPRIKNITYSYDNFSNILHMRDIGDAKKTGDERYEQYEYAYNTDKWIVDKPKRYILLNSDNSTKIRQTFFIYDRLSYGSQPTKGELTKRKDWIDSNHNVTFNYSYDSYGNILKETDPNNYTKVFTFGTRDATFTYPDKITNAKGHIAKYGYDLGAGNILFETDANGFNTSYTYDVFGRITKEIRPFDSLAYPTKNYSYYFDGIPPEKTKISQREKSGQANTLDTYNFYDGFGKLMQSRKDGEVYQLVQDIYYDNLSRVRKESNPYPMNFDDDYTSPATAISGISYAYDVIDRIVKLVNQDSTQKNITFDHWNITLLDENNHKHLYSLDAYGRIIIIEDYIGASPNRTYYKYDSADNLLVINDSKKNNFTYTYDTLGRKTSINDPDLRTWNYTYDNASNLIKQTDSRGTVTLLRYDSINRLANKTSSTEFVKYVYDEKLNGTLSRVLTSQVNTTYAYDDRLRKIGESKSIDNIIFNSNWTYDSMDRVTSNIQPNGVNISYTYNDQGLLDSIPGVITGIDYNQRNLPKGRVYSNGLMSNFTYDAKTFRLKRLLLRNWGDRQDLNYIYDNVGNVKSINDTVNLIKQSMEYDNIDRLTKADRFDNNSKVYNMSFTYDSLGRILNITKDLDDDFIFYYNGSKPVHMPYRIGIKP